MPDRPSRPRRLWVAVAAIVALIAVVVLLMRGDDDPAGSDDAVATPASDRLGPGAATGGDQRRPAEVTEPTGELPMPPGPPGGDIDVRAVLDNYLALTRYPPNSRPLGPEQLDLLDPNARHEGPLPVRTPERGETLDPAELHHFLFTGDRASVTGDETLTLTLEVWKGSARGPGVAVTIDGATASLPAIEGGADRELTAPVFQQVGDGKEVSYRSTFSPAAAGADSAGRYLIDVFFTAPDGTSTQGRLDFYYTPATAIPARFTGKFRERIEGGSLKIAVGITVMEAGSYQLAANLFDSADRPIASASFEGELAKGTTFVDFEFFGLILREQQAKSPFQLRTLRGHRIAPGENPDRALIPSYPGVYRTGMYALDAFSGEEWDSPEKQAKIEMYENLLE